MYRSVLYYLIFVTTGAVVLSFLGIVPFSAADILLQTLYLATICYASNYIFSRLFRLKPNPESQFITALILTLMIGPVKLSASNLPFLTLAAFGSMALKYLAAYKGRHIFNPAASGVLLTAIAINQAASWWVGNVWLLLFVVPGGMLMAYKIRRFHLILSFLIPYAALVAITNSQAVLPAMLHSPILFFAFVMLVEPLTSPGAVRLRIYYGIFTAIVLAFYQKFLSVPYSLELALLTGNIFARILNPQVFLNLRLVKKESLSEGISDFWFEPFKKLSFAAGQFLEYSLPHSSPDDRGIRRYFTIASSPTEDKFLLATRFAEHGSTFKTALKNQGLGAEISAIGPAGEFTLPKDPAKKLAFIAGGIGITPFRSMIKYLLDTKQKREIVLLYSARRSQDFVFQEIFDLAQKKGFLRTVYLDSESIGLIDDKIIRQEVPDFSERTFYVSGPEPMVKAFEKMLYVMGLSKKQVKRDYFPGYPDVI